MYLERGQTAYITGGSSGIGYAIARLLVERGMHVYLFARSKQKLQAATTNLESHRQFASQTVAAVSLDVTTPADVNHTIEKILQKGDPPTLLVNSAGMTYPRYFESMPYDIFDQVMQVNLYGTWNMSSAVVPAMQPRSGYIVNVSSVAGFIGVFGQSAYSASKFGVIGMSEALRDELERYNIHVSVLCPPDTQTPMFAREQTIRPPETAAIAGNTGVMQPETVARATIRGIKKRKFLIIPGWQSKMVYLLKRIAPGFVRWRITRTLRRFARQHEEK